MMISCREEKKNFKRSTPRSLQVRACIILEWLETGNIIQSFPGSVILSYGDTKYLVHCYFCLHFAPHPPQGALWSI